MCYLIAKDRDAHGCYALKTKHGQQLVEMKRELNKAVGYREPLKTRLKIFHFPLIFSIIEL